VRTVLQENDDGGVEPVSVKQPGELGSVVVRKRAADADGVENLDH
jgi:hypothetical protein